MFVISAILLLLVSICVAIHGLGMILGGTWLGHSWPRKESDHKTTAIFWLLVHVVYGLMILHLLEIAVWAVFYRAVGFFTDLGTSFYYSATSYSTVGFGNVLPPMEWRIPGAAEAVTGVLMFGWSPGVLFSVGNHLKIHFKKIPLREETPE